MKQLQEQAKVKKRFGDSQIEITEDDILFRGKGILGGEVNLADIQSIRIADLLERNWENYDCNWFFVLFPSGYGIPAFEGVTVQKSNDQIELEFMLLSPFVWGAPHQGIKWAYHIHAETLVAQARQHGIDTRVEPDDADPEDIYGVYFTFRCSSSQVPTLGAFISKATNLLATILQEAEISLHGGVVWKREYEESETLFCTEVLAPLLRKMGFLSVRYSHGVKEYGKDFTFSEMTTLGELRHYGLQAKAGNISGRVNSEIDEILGQIEDAFSMPYYELGSEEPRHISTFIVAINGRFTENAKEKIVEKMPQGAIGSVYFLDKEKILELIDRWYYRGND